MAKVIDFSKTIYELTKADPEIIGILKGIGFEQITNSTMINTVGRLMNIHKGAAMKGIEINRIKEVFSARGYQIIE